MFVRYECAVDDVFVAGDAIHHFVVVCHLRHPLGRDEAGRLDIFQAGLRELVYKLDLEIGWDVGRLVLQTVPRWLSSWKW